VFIRATGSAINKAVTVAEIVKRRVANIHQITEIDSVPMPVDLKGGLDGGGTRIMSSVSIHLSTACLDTAKLGYQPPLPLAVVQDCPVSQHKRTVSLAQKSSKAVTGAEQTGARGRGRGRGRSQGKSPRTTPVKE
jgi:ribonuclease P/MRP protein subunit RPP25